MAGPPTQWIIFLPDGAENPQIQVSKEQQLYLELIKFSLYKIENSSTAVTKAWYNSTSQFSMLIKVL